MCDATGCASRTSASCTAGGVDSELSDARAAAGGGDATGSGGGSDELPEVDAAAGGGADDGPAGADSSMTPGSEPASSAVSAHRGEDRNAAAAAAAAEAAAISVSRLITWLGDGDRTLVVFGLTTRSGGGGGAVSSAAGSGLAYGRE